MGNEDWRCTMEKERYVGADVEYHRSYFYMVVKDEKGEMRKEGEVNNDIEKLLLPFSARPTTMGMQLLFLR
jgi:hypothetical protein